MPHDPLTPGDEIRCPHCDLWHTLYQPFPDRSTAEREFLYFRCGAFCYFGGQIGETSARHAIRQPQS